MNQEDAFFQSILENPADDASRLIFGDWLMEQDDPRGELIRVQYALDETPEHDPRHAQLRERQRQLLLGYREKWIAPITELLWGNPVGYGQTTQTWDLRHGFLERISLTAQQVLDHGERLIQLAPLQGLSLIPDLAPVRQAAALDPAPMLASPLFRQLRELDLSGYPLSAAEIRPFFTSGSMPRLETLWIHSETVTAGVLQDLAESPLSRQLKTLSMGPTESVWFHRPGPRSTARFRLGRDRLAKCFPQLTHLILRDHTVSSNGVWRLVLGLTGQLRTLEIRQIPQTPQLIPDLIRESAPHLKTLILSGCQINRELLPTLASGELIQNVENLDLTRNQIGDEAIEGFLATLRAPQLAGLNLDYNRISAQGASALASSANLPSLTLLSLGNNRLGDEGARALTQGSELSNLGVLRLSYNSLRSEGAVALAAGVPQSLRILDLSWNGLGATFTKALAVTPQLQQITGLDLSYTELRDEGVTALAASSHTRNLQSLRLSTNGISDVGLAALAQSPGLGELRALDLGYNHVSTAGLQNLIQAPLFARLEALDVFGNGIDPVLLGSLKRQFRGFLGG